MSLNAEYACAAGHRHNTFLAASVCDEGGGNLAPPPVLGLICGACPVCGTPIRPESGEHYLADRRVCWACFARIDGSPSPMTEECEMDDDIQGHPIDEPYAESGRGQCERDGCSEPLYRATRFCRTHAAEVLLPKEEA